DKALVDLGANINVMLYSMFKKLGLGEPRPTKLSNQLADRSVRHLIGIIENILVKVDKLLFPIDFVMMDMGEDVKALLILRRPFLATGRTLIDVEQGKLTFRVQEEELIIEMSHDKTDSSPLDDPSCNKATVIYATSANSYQRPFLNEPLKPPFTSGKII